MISIPMSRQDRLPAPRSERRQADWKPMAWLFVAMYIAGYSIGWLSKDMVGLPTLRAPMRSSGSPGSS